MIAAECRPLWDQELRKGPRAKYRKSPAVRASHCSPVGGLRVGKDRGLWAVTPRPPLGSLYWKRTRVSPVTFNRDRVRDFPLPSDAAPLPVLRDFRQIDRRTPPPEQRRKCIKVLEERPRQERLIRSLAQGGFSTTHLVEVVDERITRPLGLPDNTPLTLVRKDAWVRGDQVNRIISEVAALASASNVPVYAFYFDPPQEATEEDYDQHDLQFDQDEEFLPPIVLSHLYQGYVPGDTVNKVALTRQPRSSWWKSMELFTDLVIALEYAHRHGVIHHDINPNNVIMAPADQPEGLSHLIDWGVSCTTDPSQNEKMLPCLLDNLFGVDAFLSPWFRLLRDAVDELYVAEREGTEEEKWSNVRARLTQELGFPSQNWEPVFFDLLRRNDLWGLGATVFDFLSNESVLAAVPSNPNDGWQEDEFLDFVANNLPLDQEEIYEPEVVNYFTGILFQTINPKNPNLTLQQVLEDLEEEPELKTLLEQRRQLFLSSLPTYC